MILLVFLCLARPVHYKRDWRTKALNTTTKIEHIFGKLRNTILNNFE